MTLTNEQLSSIKNLAKWVLLNDGTLKSFKEQLEDYHVGEMPSGSMFVIASSSRELGVPNANTQPRMMEQSTIRKIREDHDIDFDMAKLLPEMISGHVLGFDSLTHPDSVILVTSYKDKSDQDIIVAIHLNKEHNRSMINEVPSVYGKRELAYLLENTYKAGLEFYVNGNTNEWLTHAGLQLPEGLTTRLLNNNTIKHEGFDVNKTDGELNNAEDLTPEGLAPHQQEDYIKDTSFRNYPLGEKHAGATSTLVREVNALSRYRDVPFIIDELSSPNVLFAEPVISGHYGIVEVGLKRGEDPDSDAVINVIYDYFERNDYKDDWQFIKAAVKEWNEKNLFLISDAADEITSLKWYDDYACKGVCNHLCELGAANLDEEFVQSQMKQFGDKERFATDEIQTRKSIGIPDCLKTSRESNFSEEIEVESNTEYTLEPFIVDNLSTRSVLFAEPITSGRCGIVEVSLNGNLGRDNERVINVVYDYTRRTDYEDDWSVIKEAVETWCPDEPWVKFGLDKDVHLEGWGEHSPVLDWYDDYSIEDLCTYLKGVCGVDLNPSVIAAEMIKAGHAEKIRDSFWQGMT